MNFNQVKFESVDGGQYNLSGLFEGKKGLLVIFTSVQCPYALSYFEKLDNIAKNNKYSEVSFVLVNSNASIDEDVEDLEEMKKDFSSLSIPFIRDENKTLANHFKATFTPECLLLNRHYEILYRGPVDDRFKSPSDWSEDQEGFWPWDDNPPAEPEITFIEQVLEAFITEKPIPFTTQTAIGCSIK